MRAYYFIISILLSIVLFVLPSCSSDEDRKEEEFKEYKRRIIHKRKEIESFMEESPESPFKGDIKFNGLSYYAIDSSYKVVATLEYLKNQEVIVMKTSDHKEKEYIKTCKLSFTLKGNPYTLYAYKSLLLTENSLFIPFTDNTNGDTTYKKGRYLDDVPYINGGKKVILDFNTSYFPYCAYSSDFSCIIPPKENYLNTNIYAGEKK